MKFPTIRFGLMALGTAAALVSTSAHAVWVFGSTTDTTLTATRAYAATTPSVSGDPSVTLTGYSAANTSGVVSGTWSSQNSTTWAGSGLGINTGSETSPDHAIDNNGSTEGVLLNFGSYSVALNSIGLGWITNSASITNSATQTSQCSTSVAANTAKCASGGVTNTGITADVSVFRWVGGAGLVAPNLSGKAATSLTSTGWELVGNYDMGVDQTSAYNAINSGNVSSSWWLITAYNSGLTTGMNSTAVQNKTFGTVTNGDDYFKLYAVAGTVTKRIPEPASMALVGVALVGLAGARRRKAKPA